MTEEESQNSAPVRLARGTRNRQRQRLIDACISALHIHGPSRTTVEKVVAIANLSPGIVRFYFRSKAAMLVASLQYLATEFDEAVLGPVSALRETPVLAMRRLVELYLDPNLASPRKISVWYAFWGEATARQEYYEICGHKDDSFVALVRELIGRLVLQCGETHLDVDALSIGFIGLLEVLWQGFAFQVESDIDRRAARARCMAYLHSIFPRQFGTDENYTVPTGAIRRFGVGSDFAMECSRGLVEAGQFLGHVSDVSSQSPVQAGGTALLPTLLCYSPSGTVQAFVNRCTQSPHQLLSVGRHGSQALHCSVHKLSWDLNGRPVREGQVPLEPLGVVVRRGLIFLAPARHRAVSSLPDPLGDSPIAQVVPQLSAWQWSVEADWKTVVEHWLEADFESPVSLDALEGRSSDLLVDSAAGRVRLVAQGDSSHARREYWAPNTVVDHYQDGVSVTTVLPIRAGASQVTTRAFRDVTADDRQGLLAYVAARRVRARLRRGITLAESLECVLAYPTHSYQPPKVLSSITLFREYLSSLR